jgi:hypothetical protein
MLEVLSNKQIDRSKWDDIVLQNPHLLFYNHSWYLDTVAPDWEIIYHQESDFSLPVPVRKKMGFRYVFTANFLQKVQLVGDGVPTLEIEKLFLEFLLQHYPHVHFTFQQSHPTENYQDLKPQSRRNIQAPSAVLQYSISTQRNIRKAQKKEVEIQFGNITFSDIQELFIASRKDLKLPKDFFETGKVLFHQLQLKSQVIFAGAHYQRNLVAGAAFVLHKKNLTFLFSGNSAEGKKLGALHYLIHETLQQLSNQITSIDFEGSDNEGLARFYKSFGATEHVYLQLNKNALKSLFK